VASTPARVATGQTTATALRDGLLEEDATIVVLNQI